MKNDKLPLKLTFWLKKKTKQSQVKAKNYGSKLTLWFGMFSLNASRMKQYVMLQFVPFERYSHTPTLVKLYGIYK